MLTAESNSNRHKIANTISKKESLNLSTIDADQIHAARIPMPKNAMCARYSLGGICVRAIRWIAGGMVMGSVRHIRRFIATRGRFKVGDDLGDA
jgi:hypothetical protein